MGIGNGRSGGINSLSIKVEGEAYPISCSLLLHALSAS